MNRRSIRSTFLLVMMGLSLMAMAQKKEDPSSDLTFTVLKEFNGKPVKYADVILHPVTKTGKQEGGGLQVKTNDQGQATVPAIPYGKVRIQVIAKGYQTYGQDFEVNQPTHDFTIKIKSPADQYSIYK